MGRTSLVLGFIALVVVLCLTWPAIGGDEGSPPGPASRLDRVSQAFPQESPSAAATQDDSRTEFVTKLHVKNGQQYPLADAVAVLPARATRWFSRGEAVAAANSYGVITLRQSDLGGVDSVVIACRGYQSVNLAAGKIADGAIITLIRNRDITVQVYDCGQPLAGVTVAASPRQFGSDEMQSIGELQARGDNGPNDILLGDTAPIAVGSTSDNGSLTLAIAPSGHTYLRLRKTGYFCADGDPVVVLERPEGDVLRVEMRRLYAIVASLPDDDVLLDYWCKAPSGFNLPSMASVGLRAVQGDLIAQSDAQFAVAFLAQDRYIESLSATVTLLTLRRGRVVVSLDLAPVDSVRGPHTVDLTPFPLYEPGEINLIASIDGDDVSRVLPPLSLALVGREGLTPVGVRVPWGEVSKLPPGKYRVARGNPVMGGAIGGQDLDMTIESGVRIRRVIAMKFVPSQVRFMVMDSGIRVRGAVVCFDAVGQPIDGASSRMRYTVPDVCDAKLLAPPGNWLVSIRPFDGAEYPPLSVAVPAIPGLSPMVIEATR